MRDYLPFLFVLVVVAVLLRDDTVLTLFYLLVGVYFAAQWWSRRALRAVCYQRTFVRRVFPGEQVSVRLEIVNAGWLPVVWLRLHESLPVEVSANRLFKEVISLGPHGRERFEYVFQTHRRGYYAIGPLFLSSGDVLGLAGDDDRHGPPDYLTVYPRIVPLPAFSLPSRSPLGTLPHTQPIFEDPARVIGKRDYAVGDSLRRVDWKATAATGRLHVKQFEPSIALETVIALNLHSADYELRTRYDAVELAIVVAASVANWAISRKQPVGLFTNGADPLFADRRAPAVPPRRGRPHLMRVLEVLARLQTSESAVPFVPFLRREVGAVAWGATLVVVTGGADEALFEALVQARRGGLNVVLVLTSRASGSGSRQSGLGFPVYPIDRESDLSRWRP